MFKMASLMKFKSGHILSIISFLIHVCFDHLIFEFLNLFLQIVALMKSLTTSDPGDLHNTIQVFKTVINQQLKIIKEAMYH